MVEKQQEIIQKIKENENKINEDKEKHKNEIDECDKQKR
jgi:hypothetical protein